MTAGEVAGEPAFRERHYRSQEGLKLYFRDYGDPVWKRTPVVCLGGVTRNSKDFDRLAPRLAATGRRVVCPDYRGRGRSAYDPDWRRYNPRSYIQDVRHLLIALNLHRVVVIGTSLGGILATGLAAASPTALAGVVLNDVGPVLDRDGLKPIVEYMKDDRPLADWPSVVQRLRTVAPGFPARTDEEWMRIARATYREDADGWLRFDWDPDVVKPMQVEKVRKVDLWPLFRALRRLPVAVVRGGESTLLSEDTLRRMADALPTMAATTVPGVGHAPSLDEPESVEAIDALLARVD